MPAELVVPLDARKCPDPARHAQMADCHRASMFTKSVNKVKAGRPVAYGHLSGSVLLSAPRCQSGFAAGFVIFVTFVVETLQLLPFRIESPPSSEYSVEPIRSALNPRANKRCVAPVVLRLRPPPPARLHKRLPDAASASECARAPARCASPHHAVAEVPSHPVAP
jgi:hypothetical protein